VRIEALTLRWLAEQGYAGTTRRTYEGTALRFARRFPIPAGSVTVDHLIDFLTTDDDGAPTRRGSATRGRERVTLTMLFRWGYRRGLLRSDPSASLDELVIARDVRRPGRWLTRAEAIELLAAIDRTELSGQRDHALITVAVLTGLRRAELARLRWRDVDLRQHRLSVVGKGSKAAVLGLPGESVVALTSWRASATAAQRRAPMPASPVFPSGRSIGGMNCERSYRMTWATTMDNGSVCRIVARHAETAGLGVLSTHDLRRTFAGWLDEDGVDLAGIQAALRHSGPAVTVSCYLDPSPRRAVEATRNLRLCS
jgi:integrase